MKNMLASLILFISILAVISCSNEEVKTTMSDDELAELHEFRPITADDITEQEYKEAFSLVDNESEDSRFQYSTDKNEISMLQKRNAELASKSGEPFDIMVADFGGFQKYAEFVENPDHSAEYLTEIHNNYGIEYIDATDSLPHDSEKDNSGELGSMIRISGYVGLSMREASENALKQNYKNIRLVQADDEYLPVSSNCEVGRLNLWLSDSVVCDAKEDQC